MPDLPLADQPPITILLAEDDQFLQELYFDRFTSEGFVVLQAFDGKQALDMIVQHPEIQVILLDIMMPKMSGYDVLGAMRAQKIMKPTIVVSALADIDDQARGLQLGAADYITKGEMLPGAVIEKIKNYALSVSRPAQQ